MKNLNFEPGSFRDPSGRVFYKNNRVFRSLSKNGAKRFEFLKKNNLLEDLIKKEYLINSKECLENINNLQINYKYKILEHEKINFIPIIIIILASASFNGNKTIMQEQVIFVVLNKLEFKFMLINLVRYGFYGDFLLSLYCTAGLES